MQAYTAKFAQAVSSDGTPDHATETFDPEALELLAALENNEASPEIHFRLGEILYSHGNLAEAWSHYNRARIFGSEQSKLAKTRAREILAQITQNNADNQRALPVANGPEHVH